MLGRREKGRITVMTLFHIFKCLHWSRTSLSTGTAQRLLPDALSPILDRGADECNKSPTKYYIHTRYSTFATITEFYDAMIYQSILCYRNKVFKSTGNHQHTNGRRRNPDERLRLLRMRGRLQTRRRQYDEAM